VAFNFALLRTMTQINRQTMGLKKSTNNRTITIETIRWSSPMRQSLSQQMRNSSSIRIQMNLIGNQINTSGICNYHELVSAPWDDFRSKSKAWGVAPVANLLTLSTTRMHASFVTATGPVTVEAVGGDEEGTTLRLDISATASSSTRVCNAANRD
jgi:hypothetical protein